MRDKTAIVRHRERNKERGLVRVEVLARREDALLLRSVAGALADPARAGQTRDLIRQRIVKPPPKSLKALLASAPLAGIDLERSDDVGRDVDL